MDFYVCYLSIFTNLDAISLDVAIEKASRRLDAENYDNYLGSWVAAAIVDTNSWSTGNCAFTLQKSELLIT